MPAAEDLAHGAVLGRNDAHRDAGLLGEEAREFEDEPRRALEVQVVRGQ